MSAEALGLGGEGSEEQLSLPETLPVVKQKNPSAGFPTPEDGN
jgi:hypothetical protein